MKKHGFGLDGDKVTGGPQRLSQSFDTPKTKAKPTDAKRKRKDKDEDVLEKKKKQSKGIQQTAKNAESEKISEIVENGEDVQAVAGSSTQTQRVLETGLDLTPGTEVQS